jgi:transposase-like protein
VAEQRYRAVWEVLDGASVTGVARRLGVSRQSLHAWLRRYAAEEGLADRLSRPHGCPHQMAPATEAKIVEVRRRIRCGVADRIGCQLAKDHVLPVPGRTGVSERVLQVIPPGESGSQTHGLSYPHASLPRDLGRPA